jgi:hypothetical protein
MKLRSKIYKISKEEIRKALKLGKENFTITDVFSDDGCMILEVYQEGEDEQLG